jgi:DNA-binding winged helix-turn-helix (wHTH) protein
MTAVAIAKPELLDGASVRPQLDHPSALSFSPFRLDLVEERLWKGDRELRLRRKPFAVLRYLALHPKRILTHSGIVEAVWGRVAMSESLLRTHVHDLRRVLGEPVIETVVGRGYRFVANLSNVSDDEARGHTTSPGVVSPRRLELVQTSGSSGAGHNGDGPSSILTGRHARILKQVAEVLTASNANATVVVIVGDALGAPIQLSAMSDGDDPWTPV